MKLPTLTQLAHLTAEFERYESGRLWYSIRYVSDDDYINRKFEFPVPVDVPDLYDIVRDASKAIDIVNITALSTTLGAVTAELNNVVDQCEKRGAGGGQFLRSDKAITLMRWIRPHLEMLRGAVLVSSETST